MPPKIKFSRESVLQAALRLTRARGINAVNARAIAAELGCSTQPLFREFDSMEQIKEEVTQLAFELYADYIRRSPTFAPAPYKGTGMAYILFARDEPELFKLLFMSDRLTSAAPTGADDPTLDYVLSTIIERTGYTREQAQQFHLHSWIYAHGLATMLATKSAEFSEEQISALLSSQFQAYKLLFDTRIKAGQPVDKLTME